MLPVLLLFPFREPSKDPTSPLLDVSKLDLPLRDESKADLRPLREPSKQEWFEMSRSDRSLSDSRKRNNDFLSTPILGDDDAEEIRGAL